MKLSKIQTEILEFLKQNPDTIIERGRLNWDRYYINGFNSVHEKTISAMVRSGILESINGSKKRLSQKYRERK